MNTAEILKHVDHTLLKPVATWEDIQKICDESIEYKTASICIPACYISRINEKYGDKVNICTVVGFPLGYSTTEAKVLEAKQAIENGANEIDMVINISDVKNGDYDKVTAEIKAIKEAVGDKILKVIIETCLLTDEEKEIACRLSKEAGADFVKTSTGFSTGGATAHDIALMRKTVGDKMGVKASGGVRTKEDAMTMVENGATRIGASASIAIATGQKRETQGY